MRYTIPLPQLNEQHRIVARIDRLSSKIHEAQRLLRESTRQITAIRASIFASILTNDSWPIDTVGRRIGRAALRNGKSVKPGDASSNVSCLRLSAVSGGRINLSDSKPVPLTDAEASEYVIKTGDVFVMRGNGSKSLVGQAAFADATDGKTIFPDLLIRIPLANSGWTPEFFVHFWNCPIMRRQVETAAKTTAGIWKINQGHIAEMSLPCPPVEVQQRLVAIAESLVVKTAEIKAMQSKESEELNVMFTSILDRAFRGAL
jgi:type I restriction enzyme S subunit